MVTFLSRKVLSLDLLVPPDATKPTAVHGFNGLCPYILHIGLSEGPFLFPAPFPLSPNFRSLIALECNYGFAPSSSLNPRSSLDLPLLQGGMRWLKSTNDSQHHLDRVWDHLEDRSGSFLLLL